MLRKWKLILGLALAVAALGVGGVYAADAVRQAGASGGGWQRARPILGTITAIDGQQVTLKPEVPEWLQSKLTAQGITLPPLPASVSFTVTDGTRVFRNSAQASFSDFKVGDRIAARLDGDPQSGAATAKSLSDDATAQQFVDKLLQKRAERIARDGRPVAGKVLSIDGDKVTVKPEIPQELAARLAERGVTLPPLPGSVSFTVADSAAILKDNAPAKLSDFQAGDEIGALVKGDLKAGTGDAAKFMDIATARQFIQQKLGEARSRWQDGDGPLHQLANRVRGGGAGGPGEAGGQGGPGGRGGRGGNRPMFGKITAIADGKITVKPEIPDWIKQRMEENGRQLPQLPDSISFGVDSNTQYMLKGAPAKLSDFKVGDEIAAMLNGPARKGDAVALRLADAASARQEFEKRGGGFGGREGGPGGRPLFGTVTTVDKNTITIKPEVPDFIAQRMEARGKQPKDKLPAQITVSLSSSTKYFQNSQAVTADPFKAGDKVAIMPAPPSDGPGGEAGLTAAVVSDYATAQARMKDHAGQGGGRGKRGGKAGQGAPATQS